MMISQVTRNISKSFLEENKNHEFSVLGAGTVGCSDLLRGCNVLADCERFDCRGRVEDRGVTMWIERMEYQCGNVLIHHDAISNAVSIICDKEFIIVVNGFGVRFVISDRVAQKMGYKKA